MATPNDRDLLKYLSGSEVASPLSRGVASILRGAVRRVSKPAALRRPKTEIVRAKRGMEAVLDTHLGALPLSAQKAAMRPVLDAMQDGLGDFARQGLRARKTRRWARYLLTVHGEVPYLPSVARAIVRGPGDDATANFMQAGLLCMRAARGRGEPRKDALRLALQHIGETIYRQVVETTYWCESLRRGRTPKEVPELGTALQQARDWTLAADFDLLQPDAVHYRNAATHHETGFVYDLKTGRVRLRDRRGWTRVHSLPELYVVARRLIAEALAFVLGFFAYESEVNNRYDRNLRKRLAQAPSASRSPEVVEAEFLDEEFAVVQPRIEAVIKRRKSDPSIQPP